MGKPERLNGGRCAGAGQGRTGGGRRASVASALAALAVGLATMWPGGAVVIVRGLAGALGHHPSPASVIVLGWTLTSALLLQWVLSGIVAALLWGATIRSPARWVLCGYSIVGAASLLVDGIVESPGQVAVAAVLLAASVWLAATLRPAYTRPVAAVWAAAVAFVLVQAALLSPGPGAVTTCLVLLATAGAVLYVALRTGSAPLRA